MLRPLLIGLLFLAVQAAAAGVFKSVSPDGRVQYTDRPISGSERVRLPRDPSSQTPDEPPTKRAVTGADKGPYDAFEIASPEPNATIRSETGELLVSLVVAPALLEDHKVQLLVDDQPVPGNIPGTQMTVRDVTLGTHRLQAQVLDEFDVPVAYTAAISFHMRKPLPDSLLP